VTAPLRVLHAIASLSPLRGGPTMGMRITLEALRRRGVQVDVVTTDDDGPGRRRVPLDGFTALDGQRVRYFPRQSRRYSASWPLLHWLVRHVRDYDLVHTHALFSFVPVVAAWQARAARVPYLMAPHGVLDSWGMENKSAHIKRASIGLLEGRLLQQAAAVHFMSDLERRRALQLGLTLRPLVLPLGFDFSTEAPAQGVADELCADGRQVILYLSRIHEIKRVDHLLRAYAALPQRASCLLAIAGTGEPALLATLQRLAQQLGIAAQVRWLGFAAGARKSGLLSCASVFVLPSASENFGVALIEAMHAALPVICTHGAGLAEFVERAGAGVVIDDTVASLQAALTQLLADAPLRARMGAGGRRAVAQELSIDAYGSRLESFYRSVLDSSGARAAAICPRGVAS
jgi:glycosyltransferase involved in cell wall biosynthesis